MTGECDRPTLDAGSPAELAPHAAFLDAGASPDAAMLTADQQLQCIIEHTSDIIGIVDARGRLQFHSPSAERMLGYEPAMLHGRSVVELLHEADLQRAEDFFIQQVAPGAVTRTVDLRIRHHDGSWRWFSIAASPMTRPGHRPLIVINGRDVTQRRFLEAQLEQANRLNSLGRLAATVAHEFNNVLMGIQPFADLMQRPNVTPEMIAKSARYIAGSVARGKRVALDILRFTNPATPSLDAVHVRGWWQRLAPEIGASLGDNIRLTVSLDEKLFIRADPLQLSQVFTNVINNARDAMPKGGLLTVSARVCEPGASFSFGVLPPSRQYVHFAVADTGSGIPENIRSLVFDPLFTTKENGGTGLGLAVTHQVVRAHEGHVFVESDLGRGTTFHIFIPTAEPSALLHSAEPDGESLISCDRILIVDGERAAGQKVGRLLRGKGIAVLVAASGVEAITACRALRPQLAVVDIRLPDADGVEVARRLRNELPDILILFAIGAGQAEAAGDERTASIQKPFDVEALTAAIALLDERSTR